MFLKMIILLSLCFGCTTVSYLTEQGIEQAKLQWSGRDNDELLKDPKVSEEVKRKVLLVGEYKKFFYHYFGAKPTSIYSKTAMLPNKAVTYLVVASPHTKIEAHEFEFPLMGSFPYIGFFKKDSAKSFARKMRRKENLVTWIRPVYAYSTLGYLEDRILSSFFEYEDLELAELVFHELFHTIFFIKNEVDLNENLANLYGKDMLQEYFRDRPELDAYLKTEEKKTVISKRVVELIGILQTEFAKLGGFITNEKADVLTSRFVAEVFKPDLRKLCQQLGLAETDCELKEHWNQASFAAFLTYEEEQDFLKKLKDQLKLDLKGYLSWLRTEYDIFDQQDKFDSFTEYLKSKVPDAPLATH
ncbi:MAG TPA: aminopeptidase [Bacteriovoracaceae bacterium]|nr:aminopeptidase [Bacteriovoracaceae bacterium]